jgi:hypothetical protein
MWLGDNHPQESEPYNVPDDDETDDPLADAIKEPEADKTVLIAGQLKYNEEIEVIEANDDLKYNVTKDYTDSKIHMTKPIEDNVWYIEGDEIVYYDRSAIAALIKFNCKWIDYVNAGDEAVFEFVKAGSAVEKNIRDFDKVGKIEKKFKLLQIGEIRRDDSSFYIWVYEEVEDIEKNKTKESKLSGIYEIEIENDKLLISNFYTVQ